MKEVWRDIKGYEGQYKVSDLGRIKGKRGILVGKTNKFGYHQTLLCVKNKRKHCLTHRLVAQAFIPNPKNKPQVNHINGVKNDNRVENLEWVTCSENMKHAYMFELQKPKTKNIVVYDKKKKIIFYFNCYKIAEQKLNLYSGFFKTNKYRNINENENYRWKFKEVE